MDEAVGEGVLVLLCDTQWPEQPGVCCWRHGVRASFSALGVAVVRATWSDRSGGGDLAASLAGARLVIAESIGAARAAADAGVPRPQLRVLALPPEPQQAGALSEFAEDFATVAPAVGGFVTDSELARESVEQAMPGIRPVVAVFPPIAVDRTCPGCGSTGQPASVGGELGPEVSQLREWYELIARTRAGDQEVLHTFLAARLLGRSGPWAQTELSSWSTGGNSPPPRPFGSPPDWSADAQLQAARRIWAATSATATPPVRSPRSVLLAGFNLKFAVELAERLDTRPELDVVVDEWGSGSKTNEYTEKLLDNAESVFVEWLGPSAAWLSQHKRPGQFLVVRQHRYELETPHPHRIAIENVDAVVYIAPRFGRRIRDELCWPAEKLIYLPNFLDIDWFDRPKLPEAAFGIGMVGMESRRKRFDLALDLLANVRRTDPRYTLFVRSVPPWNSATFWKRREEREYAGWCLERIRQDPLLRGAVVFDPPGRDMARWYRKVGHVLSTSDDEGSHMAPAEGMASGSVPVIRPWPGAVELYGLEWLHTSTEDAAAAILTSADDPAGWAERAARAQAEIRRSHDPTKVLAAWADLLHGDIASARAHFAEYTQA